MSIPLTSNCDGRKIEHPNDSYPNHFIYFFIDKLNPILYNLGFTPNIITTLSLYPGYKAVTLLQQKNIWCIFYYFLYVLLDYSDGHLARTYNMTSKFGDLYDHARDIIIHFFILYNLATTKSQIILITVLLSITLVSFGCQETQHSTKCVDEHNGTLDWTKRFCPTSHGKLPYFDTYFGTSFIYIFTIILMFHRCLN